MQNFAFLEKPSAVNVLTRYKFFLGKCYNAFFDSTNVFRYHFTQNNDFEKLPRCWVNTFATNYEYTRGCISKSRHFCTFWRPESEYIRFYIKFYIYLEWFYAFKITKSSFLFGVTFCIFRKTLDSERVITVWKCFGKMLNAFFDSTNVFRDHFRQNNVLKSCQGVELTRSLPTTSILLLTIEFYCT